MNSVSWFIYIAQVSSSLGVLFVSLGAFILVAASCQFGFVRICNHLECISPGDNDYLQQKPLHRGYISLAVGFLVLGNLMPERNTLYAIAASQVGEQIVKTEIASDATKALHAWIKKQIEPDAKK